MHILCEPATLFGEIYAKNMGWEEPGLIDRIRFIASVPFYKCLYGLLVLTAVSKTPDKNSLRKEGFVLALGLREDPVLHVGKAWWQEGKVTAHTEPIVRMQREVVPSFISLISLFIPAHAFRRSFSSGN